MFLGMLMAISAMGPGASPYALDPLPHLVATAGMWGVVSLSELAKHTLPEGLPCVTYPKENRCDPARLVGLDRGVVANHSAAWRTASNVGLYLSLGIPVVADVWDAWLDTKAPHPSHAPSYPHLDRHGGAERDILVIGESLAVAGFLTQLLKFTIRRPRPPMYQENGQRTFEYVMSFPSGHTSGSAALTTAYSMTFGLRHPQSPWRFVVMGAGAALTLFTGYGRVGGGMHFYSDVAAGALLGGTVGFLVPYVNRYHMHAEVSVASGPPHAAARCLDLVLPMP